MNGIALMIVGNWARKFYEEYRVFLYSEQPQYASIATLMMTSGGVIFFVSVFGCCGAFRENYCMIIAVRKNQPC